MASSLFTLRTDVYGPILPEGLKGSLRGQVALITGSSRGIGKHIAHALASAGASIAINGRNRSTAEEACRDVSAHGTRCEAFIADVLGDQALDDLVAKVESSLGSIDILVLNAGTNTFMPFHYYESDAWWQLMELNVRAPVALTRRVLPGMKARNSGTIIFLSSRAAVMDLPWTTAYNCSKAAITKFAASLRAELEIVQRLEGGFEQNEIQVFSMHPGEIETDLHETAFPDRLKRQAPYVLEHMKKIGEKRPHFSPALPAWTAVFLASGRAKGLNGRYVDATRDIGEALAMGSRSSQ